MKNPKEIQPDVAKIPDRILIKEYLDGSNQAFDLLYERYRKPIFAYLCGMLTNQQDVINEIFQQTWIKAIKNLPRYRDKNIFISWILRIARNTTIDYFRRNKRFLPLDNDAVNMPGTGRSPREEIIDRQNREELQQAISALPDEQKEVVLLRGQNLTFKQIATIQKVSINTVLGRMRYAIINLRANMTAKT